MAERNFARLQLVAGFASASLLTAALRAEEVPQVAAADQANAPTRQSISTTPRPLPAEASGGIEEVVVTARRQEERLQDVPVAVTVLSGEALQSRGIVALDDLNFAVPGLSVTPANSPTSLIFTIRGLANQNPNSGSDAAVGFYLNDVPINLQNGTNIGMFDLQNVQVLKGPQGTLFGRNTTGGAILINTNRPVDHFDGYAQAGGTYFKAGNGWQSEGMLNIPLGDQVALRLAVATQNRDGWVRNVIDRNAGPAVFNAAPLPFGTTHFNNQGGIDSQAWRASINWKITPDIENLTVYEEDRMITTALAPNTNALNPNGPVAVFGPFLGVPNPTTAWQKLQNIKSNYFWSTETVSNNPLNLKTSNFSNTTSWQLGDLLLKNIAGYRKVDEDYGQDIVGLPGEYFVYREHTGGENLSDELQLQGQTADRDLHWVTGLFYFHEKRFGQNPMQIAFDTVTLTSTDLHSTSSSYSIFAQGTQQLHWLEGLSLTAGVRYTVDDRRARLTRLTSSGTCVFPGYTAANCLLTGSSTFKKPTYTISLDYKWNPDSLVYLATHSGYRSGGYSTTAGNAASFAPFRPETVTEYELGLKKDWRLGTMPVRTNVAVFYEDYKDIQRLVVDPANITIQNIRNAGAATVKGGELELTWLPVKNLQIDYSFAYVHPYYDEFVDAGVSYAGKTFAFAPHFTHNISAAYTLPTDPRIGEITLRGEYYHQSDMFRDDEKQTTAFGPPQTLTQAGYGMLNLDMSVKSIAGTPLDLELFVKNANDVKVTPNGAPTYNSFGIGITFFSVPPRMMGFNLRYNFQK